MTGLEETFRTVLAARLPDDPKWATWIDGTVAELAGSVPGQGIDRDALEHWATERIQYDRTDGATRVWERLLRELQTGRFDITPTAETAL